MSIREVDVPGALVEAHRSRELVLFVGAGASRAVAEFKGHAPSVDVTPIIDQALRLRCNDASDW